MADEATEKTEQATPRKLQRAKERGQVPRSQELGSVVVLTGLIVSLAMAAPMLLQWLKHLIIDGLALNTEVFSSPKLFVRYANGKLIESMLYTSPVTGTLVLASILGTLAVGGYTLSTESLKLRWDSLNPAKNMQNAFSTKAIVKLVLSVAKMFLVSFITWLYLRNRIDTFTALRWAWTAQILTFIAKTIFGFCLRVALVLLIIAIADTVFQKWKFGQEMRMSHQDLKQEHKDIEGSPELKARMRKLRMEMVMQQLRDTVPKADVVLVNPTHYAVALQYDAKTMESPIVVAKGADLIAKTIRELARAHGIPIVRRPELARTLYSTVEPGRVIPQDLFMAVAEVLALIYRLRQKRKQ